MDIFISCAPARSKASKGSDQTEPGSHLCQLCKTQTEQKVYFLLSTWMDIVMAVHACNQLAPVTSLQFDGHVFNVSTWLTKSYLARMRLSQLHGSETRKWRNSLQMAADSFVCFVCSFACCSNYLAFKNYSFYSIKFLTTCGECLWINKIPSRLFVSSSIWMIH